MYAIAETSIFIREQIELPASLKLATQEFREGWNFVAKKDALLLEKNILRKGWNYIGMVDGWMRSGIGETVQAAVGNALNLALRQVSPHFNAVEVDRIDWTQYRWFFLARVMVKPNRIQMGDMMPVLDEALLPRPILRPKLLPRNSAALFPNSTSAMPMLKEMLVKSRSSRTRIQ